MTDREKKIAEIRLEEIPKPDPVSSISQYAKQFGGTLTGEAFQDLFDVIDREREENRKLIAELETWKDHTKDYGNIITNRVEDIKQLSEENQKLIGQVEELQESLISARENAQSANTAKEFLEEENNRLREENAELRSKLEGWVELKKSQQEIERLQDVAKTLQSRLDESGVLYCEIQKRAISAEQDREKLIEGLRNILKELDKRCQKDYQNHVIDSDSHQLGMAEAYDVAEYRLREILKEIGVTVGD